MYSIERKSEILNQLTMQGKVRVNSLSRHLDVSKETIRRDLRQMEEEGILLRTHGGAVLPKDTITKPAMDLLPEPPVEARGMINTELKHLLCKKAVSFIRSGDIIYVDNSSTTLFLPQYIPEHIDATIITNSILFLTTAAQLNKANLTYICLGGIFKGSNLSIHGNITTQNANNYYPNKAFLSCTGITKLRSITDSSIEEVTIKKQMIDNSHKVFLLADHTKFKQDGQIFLSPVDSIDYVITDCILDSVDYSFLTVRGTQLVVTDSDL